MIKPARPISLFIPLLTVIIVLGICFLISLFFPAKPHVILIGLDGVPPEIVESMMARGELPNLAAIEGRGNFSKLHTHPFSHTRLVWPIIYTGVGPERDGITIDIASEFEKIAITPSMRKVPAIWEVVADAGGRATLISIYESYPAERTDNIVEVSDRIWNLPDLAESPPEAFSSDKVREWALVRMLWAQKDPWLEHTLNFLFTDAGYSPSIKEEMSKNREVMQLLRAQVLERVRRDILCVRTLGIAGALRDCDLLVVYFEGTDIVQHCFNDGIPPSQRSLGRRKVEGALRIYDAALGKIIDTSPPGSYVCVVSDHGFDLAPEKEVTYRLRRGVTQERASQLMDMALKAKLDGISLFRDVKLEGQSIKVSVNDALGTKQIISALNFLRQEPDVVPEAIGYFDDHTAGIHRNTPEKYDKEATPPVGIYFLAGPGVRKQKQPGITSIYNVTPTLVYALGLGVASDLDGRPNLDMFGEGWLHGHPLKAIASFPPRKNVSPQTGFDNSDRLAELQGLGYIDR